ncbi:MULTISPECIES: hypothetical protein [Pseudomonas]|jgi:hypothetical protein|uniref:Uncharacterized protein n=1 Tax=Pseudomonas versuta TaxID=1788301 RepID=A0A0M4QGP0_9PSED|nr:hypothetical protein [Pseudomonas versuta]ALE87366.1 hypothetical protein AOC04_03655 [Pseudomonas versuta]OKA20080.1 hypothetical protein BOH73_13670 [Pseudomonas versuta]OKA27616.1 hypothetical protein BOH74_04490 [Pseudomonas versuta]
MSHPEMPQNASRREMRKLLIRLRMEMHRQEIRHESQQLLQPLQKVRGMASNWQENLGIKHGSLWAVGLVSVLGFLTGRSAKSKGSDGTSRWIGLTTGLLPLIKMVIQAASRKP